MFKSFISFCKDSYNTSKEFVNRHPVYKAILRLVAIEYLVSVVIMIANNIIDNKKLSDSKKQDESEE